MVSTPQDIRLEESTQQILKKKRTDHVKNDSILKELVKKECTAQMEWERKWKSLKGDEINRLSERIRSNFNVDVELLDRSSLKVDQTPCVKNNNNSHPKTPYPILTSQLIGWTRDNLDLNTRRLHKNKYYKTTTQASLWIG